MARFCLNLLFICTVLVQRAYSEETNAVLFGTDDTIYEYHRAKMGSEVHQGNWNKNYPAQFIFSMKENTYIYGHSEDKKWFIREISSNGTMSDWDSSSGVWERYYRINVPFSINAQLYFYRQSDTVWDITEILKGDRMGETFSGTVGDWKHIVPFLITGKQFLYFLDNPTAINEWLIQALLPNGKMGDTIQRNKWNAAYKTPFIFYMKEKPYIYCAGEEKWFIREILPNAKMGPQTDQGFWSYNFDTSLPFSFRGSQYVYLYAKEGSFWEIRELLSGGKMGATTDSGYWTHKYDVMLPFSIIDKTYIYGNAFADNSWFIRDIVSSTKK